MKKAIYSISLVLMMAGCGSKDEKFCKCLDAGKELNAYSTKMFSEELTNEKAEKLKSLKKAKKQACLEYETMNGPELLKRKSACSK